MGQEDMADGRKRGREEVKEAGMGRYLVINCVARDYMCAIRVESSARFGPIIWLEGSTHLSKSGLPTRDSTERCLANATTYRELAMRGAEQCHQVWRARCT